MSDKGMGTRRAITFTALAIILVALFALLVRVPGHETTPTSAAEAGEVIVSNVRDGSFTVSWTAEVSSTGQVRYGTNPSRLTDLAQDERGAETEDDTHYVTVRGLKPETLYYFDVEWAGGIDNSGGAHYQVRTGPTLPIPGSDTVYGRVYRAGGSEAAEGAIVYLRLTNNNGLGSSGEAALLSGLVDGQGYWTLNLGNARQVGLESFFTYESAGDLLEFVVDGAAEGESEAAVDTADDTPAQDLVLGTVPSTITPEPTDTPTPGGPTATATDEPGPTATNTPTPSTLINDLVSYWAMEEPSGSRLDSHGTNDLADQSTVGSQTGKLGTASQMVAGSQEYLSSGASGLNFGSGDFSVSLWLRPSTDLTVSSSGGRFVQRRGTGAWGFAPGFQLAASRYGSATSLTNAGLDDGNVGSAFPGTPLGDVDEWTHLVLTVDRAADEARLYVDNALAFTHDISAVTGSIDNARNFTFGASDSALTQFFDGSVDEAAVWNRVLTGDEVSSLWNGGSGIGYPFGGAGPAPTAEPTATPGASTVLRAGSGYGFVGEPVTVTLELSLGAGEEANSTTALMEYSREILRPLRCEADPGNAWDSRLCNMYYDADGDGNADAVRVNAASVVGVTGETLLAEVVFETIGSSGAVSSLTAVMETLRNAEGADLESTTEDGEVRVHQMGDVDCDNGVDSTDSALVLQYDAALLGVGNACPPGAESLYSPACDVNKDGICDLGDALMILQCDVGLVNPLCPVVGLAVSGFRSEGLQKDWIGTIRAENRGAASASPAQGENRIELAEADVPSGGLVQLPLRAEIGYGRVSALSVELRYDPDEVSIRSCEKDPAVRFASGLCNGTYDRNGDGRADAVRLSLLSATGVSGDFDLARLELRGAGRVGTRAELQVVLLRAVDAGGEDVPMEVNSTAVTIGAPEPVPGPDGGERLTTLYLPVGRTNEGQ